MGDSRRIGLSRAARLEYNARPRGAAVVRSPRDQRPPKVHCVSHEHLWAPWRLNYVKGDAGQPPQPAAVKLLPGGDEDCFLCRGTVETTDRENLVVHRGPRTVTIINRFPYNNGHLLIAPQRHLGRLDQLDQETHLECIERLNHWTQTIERLMRADGFNVGLNLGRVAGAGVPGHLHWHIVPRWNGDTNFMPVIGDTKVIPQALEALWELLTGAE